MDVLSFGAKYPLSYCVAFDCNDTKIDVLDQVLVLIFLRFLSLYILSISFSISLLHIAQILYIVLAYNYPLDMVL